MIMDKEKAPGARKLPGDGKIKVERSGVYVIDEKKVGKMAYARHQRKEKKVKARAQADTVKDLNKKLKTITAERDRLSETVALAAKNNIALQETLEKKNYELLETDAQKDYFKEILDRIVESIHEYATLKKLILSLDKSGTPKAELEVEIAKERIDEILPMPSEEEPKEPEDKGA